MSDVADIIAGQRGAVPRVLVVDADPRFRPLLVRVLRKAGFAVEGAATMGAALEVLNALELDVMLCERRLPDGSGCDLMRAALRRRSIKGIVVSDFGGAAELAECRAAGFVEYLNKPVAVEPLLAAIERAMQDLGGARSAVPAGYAAPNASAAAGL